MNILSHIFIVVFLTEFTSPYSLNTQWGWHTSKSLWLSFIYHTVDCNYVGLVIVSSQVNFTSVHVCETLLQFCIIILYKFTQKCLFNQKLVPNVKYYILLMSTSSENISWCVCPRACMHACVGEFFLLKYNGKMFNRSAVSYRLFIMCV